MNFLYGIQNINFISNYKQLRILNVLFIRSLTLWNVDKVPGDVVDEDVSAPVAGEQDDEAGESELCLLPAHCNCTQVHSTVNSTQCTV